MLQQTTERRCKTGVLTWKRARWLATGMAALALMALAIFLAGWRNMKMNGVEKFFVNGQAHAEQVALRSDRLLDHIRVKPGQRYLDIGCGVGSAARLIAGTRALEVTGIDIDPDQIHLANNGATKPNLQFRVMDATRLLFPDGHFDIVATSKTLHHIPDRKRAFGEMARVLRPGGYLVFTDFALPAWLPAAGLSSESTLDTLAAHAGLTMVYRARSWATVDLIWQKARLVN